MNTTPQRPPHPLEEVFGIDEGSTLISQPIQEAEPVLLQQETLSPVVDIENGEIVQRSSTDLAPDHDREERIDDLHIDKQLETIHNSALIAFEKQSRMSDEVDPRFAARNAEVAAAYLNIALNSVNSRIDAKFKRNKIRMAKTASGQTVTVNHNNMIVGDRNDILRDIMKETEGEVLENEAK